LVYPIHVTVSVGMDVPEIFKLALDASGIEKVALVIPANDLVGFMYAALNPDVATNESEYKLHVRLETALIIKLKLALKLNGLVKTVVGELVGPVSVIGATAFDSCSTHPDIELTRVTTVSQFDETAEVLTTVSPINRNKV